MTSTINFVGPGVTAVRVGNVITVTIPVGGAGGGWATSTATTTLTGSPTIAMGTNSTRVTGLGGGFIFNYDRAQTTQTPWISRTSVNSAADDDFSIQIIETNFNNGDNRWDPVMKFGYRVDRPGGCWWAFEGYFEGRNEMIMGQKLENGNDQRRIYFYMHRVTGSCQSFFTTDSHEFRPSTTDGSQAAAYVSMSTSGIDTYGAYSITKGAGNDQGHFSLSVGGGGAVTLISDGAGDDTRMIFSSTAGHSFTGLGSFNNGVSIAGTATFSGNTINMTGADMKLGLGPEYTVQYISAGTLGGAMDFVGPDGYYFRFWSGPRDVAANCSVSIHRDTGSNTLRYNIKDLPTSASGLSAGDLWNSSGTLRIA